MKYPPKLKEDYISKDENGKLHSINDEAAYVSYYDNGDKINESWFNHSLPHRLNGPAYIWYFGDGTILSSLYYINAEYFHSKSDWEIERNRIIMLNEVK